MDVLCLLARWLGLITEEKEDERWWCRWRLGTWTGYQLIGQGGLFVAGPELTFGHSMLIFFLLLSAIVRRGWMGVCRFAGWCLLCMRRKN